jgi:drug/metabolite transporter (DMT)-like permease
MTRGLALCVASAVGFGLMAIFAKEAYRSGVSVTTLLALRFAIAAGAFWAIVALRRPVTRPPRALALGGLALGIGYAAQAAGYFGALTRIDASLTSLLTYTYPALVFGAAVALRRERADRRRLAALGLATGGAALVVAGGGPGALDALGVALALGAAAAYATYILVADRVVGRIDAFLPSASAAILRDVAPATASIVSTVEPVVTVGLAMLVFGERLGGVQLAGGALVLGAVILLAAKVRKRVAATHAPASAPARALASQPA